MQITPVDRNAPASTTTETSTPVAVAAENRDVVRAIKSVNSTEMFGADKQLIFRRDPETNRMVIRLVNRETQEVISQIPEEYLLRLAKDLELESSLELEK